MLLPKLVWKNYGTLKENYDSKLFLKVKPTDFPSNIFMKPEEWRFKGTIKIDWILNHDFISM